MKCFNFNHLLKKIQSKESKYSQVKSSSSVPKTVYLKLDAKSKNISEKKTQEKPTLNPKCL